MATRNKASNSSHSNQAIANANPYLDEDLINHLRKETIEDEEQHHSNNNNRDYSISQPSLGGLDESHSHNSYSYNVNSNNSQQQHSNLLHCHMSSPHKFLDTHEPITLNVGGVKYQTTLTTLAKYKHGLLYKMFDGSFSKKANKDGSYFIDRNGKHFDYILDYLRNGKLNIVGADSYLLHHLLIEADYYQIHPLMEHLQFMQIGSKLLSKRNLQQIEAWVIEEFAHRSHSHSPFAWKLLYAWNCDDITLKNPYNVMHAKCEGISSILIVLLCGNRVFGSYCSCKWKAKDVTDDESFVYWLAKPAIHHEHDEQQYEDEEDEPDKEGTHKDEDEEESEEERKKQDCGDRKLKFHYDSYREFKSYDANSENHRSMKFCGGYNDVVVCRYRAAKHQYGHFSIYTNETGYTVTASGPLSLDNSMHLQRMEIFHL